MNATRFLKQSFHKSGPYLLYGPAKEFVARFKYNGPFSLSKFVKELIANHTVEDYFFQLQVSKKAPLEILREKNPTWYESVKTDWYAKHS